MVGNFIKISTDITTHTGLDSDFCNRKNIDKYNKYKNRSELLGKECKVLKKIEGYDNVYVAKLACNENVVLSIYP